MTKFTDKIISEIKTNSIKPKPLWQFKLKETGGWLSVGLSVVMAGLLAALLWYFLVDLELGFGRWIGHRSAMRGPGLIIILLLLLTVTSWLLLRKTKHGYRYNYLLITAILSFLVLISAWGFDRMGYNRRVDQSLSMMPFYENRNRFMGEVWQQPEQGRLAGEIVSLAPKDQFKFKDLSGKEWSVAAVGAIWRHNLKPEVGLQVKLLGRMTDDYHFVAEDIRPWMGGNCGQMMEAARPRTGGCGMMR